MFSLHTKFGRSFLTENMLGIKQSLIFLLNFVCNRSLFTQRSCFRNFVPDFLRCYLYQGIHFAMLRFRVEMAPKQAMHGALVERSWAIALIVRQWISLRFWYGAASQTFIVDWIRRKFKKKIENKFLNQRMTTIPILCTLREVG